MDLLQSTKEICKLYNLFPKKSLGQNFLISSEIYDKIIGASNLTSKDKVLEIGAGVGFLTALLAKKAESVYTVELDNDIAEVIKTALLSQEIENTQVINQDILDFKPQDYFKNREYKIVANLPYNITSVFLRKFLSTETKPFSLTLMLQKEVAERIVAQPSQMSLLSNSVNFYAEAEIVEQVKKDNFWPQPKVDSAIINIKTLDKRNRFDFNPEQEKEFFRFLKIGFSAKRKKLKNNLAGGLRKDITEVSKIFKDINFSENIRAQELSLEDWKKLFGQFFESMI